MEKSRSWPSAHDWKSCIPQKGIEGSNPSFSAKMRNPEVVKTSGFFVLYALIYRLNCSEYPKRSGGIFAFLPYGIFGQLPGNFTVTTEGLFCLICSPL